MWISFKRSIKALISVCLIVTILFVALPGAKCFAHDEAEHNRIMDEILFGRSFGFSASWQKKIDALHAASYLAIDQYNGHGQDKLNMLNDYGVSDIPDDIQVINYSAWGKDHRQYTHKGWNQSSTKGNWEVRKKILINTVGKVFNFSKSWDSNTLSFEYNAKAQNMAAFIYYIHILGDYDYDLGETPYYYYGGSTMLHLASSPSSNSVINDMKTHLKIVFKDQNNTHSYNELISGLTVYNSSINNTIRSSNGYMTDEDFESLFDDTKGVIGLLKRKIPSLLNQEDFYTDTFPSNGGDSSTSWDWLPWNKHY